MAGETKLKKIMAAVDGSPASENALKYAIFLAARFEAEIIAVTVLEEEKIGYWRFIDEHLKKEIYSKSREALNSAEKIARQHGLEMKTYTLKGTHADEEIVRFIEQTPELTSVVMGDHGLGLHGRQMLGSTTERVIREIAKRGIPVVVSVVPYVAPESPACKLYAGPLCE